MVEIQQVQQKPFTTIQFVTKDGEKCTATKNNGIVTVTGDKNGVRQVPFDQFMKELVETLPKNVDLERTPNKDKVQFSGNENTQTPPAQTLQEEQSVEETNKKLNKKYLGIAAVALALVSTGIYFLGKGKWWSKAAKEVEKKGQELADDITESAKEGLKGGKVKAGESTEKTTDEVVTQSEEHISKQNTPHITAEKNLFVAKSPIPKEEIFQIPKDLETDVEKVVKNGIEVARGFDTVKKGVDTVTYTIHTSYGYRAYRVHETNGKPIKIQDVLDYGKDTRPFRTFEFKNGQVHSITDHTSDGTHKKFFEVNKKNTAKPKDTKNTENSQQRLRQQQEEQLRLQRQQEEERLQAQRQKEELKRIQEEQEAAERLRLAEEEERRRVQEAADNDIINAAVISDMMSSAGKKGAQTAETAVNEGITKIEAPKIEIPSSQSVVDDGKNAADELFAHNPKSSTGNPSIERTNDFINPNDNVIPQEVEVHKPYYETDISKTALDDPFNRATSEFDNVFNAEPEIPKITYEEPIDFGSDLDGMADDFMDGGFFG